MQHRREAVLVYEPELGKGGQPFETSKEQCPDDLRQEIFSYQVLNEMTSSPLGENFGSDRAFAPAAAGQVQSGRSLKNMVSLSNFKASFATVRALRTPKLWPLLWQNESPRCELRCGLVHAVARYGYDSAVDGWEPVLTGAFTPKIVEVNARPHRVATTFSSAVWHG